MKIAIVLGTRPEIIKMASIIDEILKKRLEMVLIHTGQHYDPEMSDNFFKDLELPFPDYNIEVGSSSHGKQTAKMMEGIEDILIKENPDILLVQGDTNAVLAGALVASKLHIPVGHVEAGLRSYDDSMPEEINRKAADVCSLLYFVPTEQSAINLAIEGISRDKIHITGNTVVDACFRNLKISQNRNISDNLSNLLKLDNIIVLTMHRAENVDNKERLTEIIDGLARLTDFNIIFPIHPRTLKTLENFDLLEKIDKLPHFHVINPVGYLDFLLLLSKSTLILTDSGGLQEEAITLNIPALTLRYNTERPETVDAGGNILVGSNKDKIIKFSEIILNNKDFRDKMQMAPNPYGTGDSAKKILDIILNKHEDNLLNIESPDEIMNGFKTKIVEINNNILVKDFEKDKNAKVRVIYNKSNLEFPQDDLNLNNKIVLFDLLD